MRVLFTLLLLPVFCFSADKQFPVSEISEELKENANMVIRLREGNFRIEAIDRAVYRERLVITILNESAKDYGWVTAHYDKLIKITHFDATVYDASGESIDRIKKSEILDQSNIPGSTLYDDSRVRGADMRQEDYPYTVDFEYEMAFSYLFHIPDWQVIIADKSSVERSTFSVSAPTGLLPRFKLMDTIQEPITSEVSGITTHYWEFKNLKAQEREPFSNIYKSNPKILISPSLFQYEDYKGDMSTWDGFAAWQRSLNEGRNDLSEEARNMVKSLVANLETDEEKVKAIYEYMQSKTRYVSIQLGVGGFQPFNASIVENEGYGDCKALSFYTLSLLETAGIKSHYTIVYGGDNPPKVDPDFPNNTFNHIILCVPNKGDTLWLECTSQTNPMGYLGSFTGDRDVMVVTENGGKIVRTPAYDYENNHTVTKAVVDLDKKGNALSEVTVKFIGKATDHKSVSYYVNLDDKKKRDWLTGFISLPNYDINSFNFEQTKGMIPEVMLTMNVDMRQIASTSEKRIFLKPNLLNEQDYVPKRIKDRATTISLRNAYLETDTIIYNLPVGTFLEQPPEPTKLETKFGIYETNYIVDDAQLIYIRRLSRNKGEFPAEDYADLVDFYKKIRRLDRKKILINTET